MKIKSKIILYIRNWGEWDKTNHKGVFETITFKRIASAKSLRQIEDKEKGPLSLEQDEWRENERKELAGCSPEWNMNHLEHLLWRNDIVYLTVLKRHSKFCVDNKR